MTNRAQTGFTLVEAIIAMVITGIVAGIVSVFMAYPINAYLDSSRRADLTNAADLALRRMGFEIRGAVPNSVRLYTGTAADTSCDTENSNPTKTCRLEFIPTKDGGRYRLEGPGDILNATEAGGDTKFDVLGPPVSGAAGDYLIIFNTGQTGLSAYEDSTNRRALSGAASSTVAFTNSGVYPSYESPAQRFQIAPATGPVQFVCNASANNNKLTRRTNYYSNFNDGNTEPPAALLVENISQCRMSYEPLNAENGLVTLQITLSRDGESATLLHQLHVDNTP